MYIKKIVLINYLFVNQTYVKISTDLIFYTECFLPVIYV